jgi:putative ABC transport system permease protein
MIRSFMTLYQADLGAQTASVLTARVNLIEGKYPDAAARVRFVEQLDAKLRALPGIEHAGIGTGLPGEPVGLLTLDLEGQPRASRDNRRETRVGSVTHGYFETFGIRATQGRLLEPRDGQPGAEAVVVNELFAVRHFGGNAVGRRIMLRGDADAADTVWATIVGVIPHVRHGDLISNTLDPVVYRPFAMSTSSGFAVALRSRIPPETLIATVRQTVQSIDQDLPVFQPRTMEENLARQRWPFRVFGTLFVLFAIFGLVLSTIGVYAVTAYSVGQRRNEIGLRMALGAQQSQIGWLVLRRGLLQLAAGLPLGLILAFLVMKAMESLLIGLRPGDPLTMAAIALIVVAVTLVACLLPARRAARLSPVSALRN